MGGVMTKDRPGNFFGVTAICAMAYFVSYVTRTNLAAIMVAVVESGFAPEATVALALSVCSVTYGVGQILNGYISDRTKPQYVVLFGFALTIAMNLGAGFLRDARYLVLLWAVNGFAQSCMWPPLVAIMASSFSKVYYDKAVVWVSWGHALGNIAVYLVSPPIIRLWGYRYVFLLSGALGIVMAVAWMIFFSRKPAPQQIVEQKKHHSAPEAREKMTGAVLAGMILVLLAIVMQGSLRDGVTNWTPTMISQTLPVDTSTAIFSGVLLPVFHMICTKVISGIHGRWIKNELVCAAAVFAVGTAAALLLAFTMGRGVILSVVLLALLVGCMHAANYLLVCLMPVRFFRYGRVGLISGVMNAFAYVGSAISTYGIAVFSGVFGWRQTVLLWAGIALVGGALCLLATKNKQI